MKEIHQSPFGNGIEQQHSPLRIPLHARLVPKLSFVDKIISVLDFYDKQQFVCQPQYLKELIIKYITKLFKNKTFNQIKLDLNRNVGVFISADPEFPNCQPIERNRSKT